MFILGGLALVRLCMHLFLYAPLNAIRLNSPLLLVSGVGHCHWELQHPLGETCSPPGCLPPAGLAYVWLDHVPGTTLDNWTRLFFGLDIHPLMQVKRAREAGPASAEKSSAEKSRARKTEQERAKARKARKEEDPLPEADQKIKAN